MNPEDWFTELNDEDTASILKGLAEADNGKLISHADLVTVFEKWGLKDLK